MPIAFARLEFVKRSSGKNACGKSAYNSRSRIHFQGNEWMESKTYDWSHKPPPVYHEVLLPNHVDQKFQSPSVLWNAAEQKEVRRNSQTAFEMVLALPDDQVISLEDRKYLARTFVEEHFVKNGLAAQVDIHAPEQKHSYSEEKREIESSDHNWHAHVVVTTRRFKENGLEFDEHKARDLMPILRSGKVISGPNWGKIWAQHQNTYFEQKGLSLRVDSEGVVPQRHLGPVRMRGRAFSLLYENDLRISLNSLESENPQNILERITHTKNIFTPEDVDAFLHKHVDPSKVFEIQETFWKEESIVQLLDPNSHKPLQKFTTKEVIEEEKQLLRLGDRLNNQKGPSIHFKKAQKFEKQLTEEQKAAFKTITSQGKLCCIEGHAGTGKSHLLKALKETYESQGYIVRGFGPDSATSHVLKEKGFIKSENIYRFVFALHKGKREIRKNREVWVLDEAGKLGTRPLLEFLKFANRYGVKVILSGNSAQLASVERGVSFQLFSQRYGAATLENIQRQKDEAQREIAKKLALGEMGHALDSILRLGDIKWSPTKEGSLEALVKAWAANRIHHPNESTVIIAHSNKEVKTLNELVRIYRKEAGELKGKEYECETAYGKIYVGPGDRIEFRKNDKSLEVTNGVQGVLIKASTESFTVQVKEGKNARNISFDPRHYRSFQLGYATTYYRSQGRTVDTAYVLHSPMMNKEMFYVGLTRHVKKAEFYISESDAKYLSDVKRQAFRTQPRNSTLDYRTQSSLEKAQYNEKLEKLKSSDSFKEKARGWGLTAWDEIKLKTSEMLVKYKDQQANQSFFNPKIEKEPSVGTIRAIEETPEPISIDQNELSTEFKKILAAGESFTKAVKTQTKQDWSKFSESQRASLKRYFRSIDKASSLHMIVNQEQQKGSHFQSWQEACRERNALAYEIVHSFKLKELKSIMEVKSLEILQQRASKHEYQLQRKENSLVDLDGKLKENLDALLHKLFPEGPTRRDGKGLRFGAKGSLAVTCSGSKRGSFFDFENHEGGGLIQLIQKSLRCSQREAIQWAKEFTGEAKDLLIPSHFTFRKVHKEQEWVSLKPDPTKPAPSLKKLSKSLTLNYEETARYTYRNEEGKELFHVLRLEDKQEPGKKIVLPLSYGYCKGNEQEPDWSLKGYQADKKPLYNLHLLKEYPKAKVLIVEGEKTADAALKLYPNQKMISVSWIGGAGAVFKTDWSPLKGREVIIWPDNDKAGFEASDFLCRSLQQTGLKSLSEVSRQNLAQSLPQKWDLADPLPEDKNKYFINRMILRAEKKELEISHQDQKIQEYNRQKLPKHISRDEREL